MNAIKIDWVELWIDDRKSMLETMLRNMQSDLAAGYNYFGKSITEQRARIDLYAAETQEKFDRIQSMREADAQRWCHRDLKMRGAVE